MIENEVEVHYSTLKRLAPVAEDQRGLLTRRQAESAGVSPATLQRLASAGVLDRVAREDPEAVALVVADATRAGHEDPKTIAGALAPYAARLGLRREDAAGPTAELAT